MNAMKKTFFRRMLAKPWLRVQLCSMVMGSVLLAGGAAYAAHRVRASAIQLGSEIMTNVAPMKGAQSISFNGSHFYFGSQVYNAKLDDVVASARTICKHEGADLQRELGTQFLQLPLKILPESVRSKVDFSEALTSGSKSKSQAEVACWVRRSQGPTKTFMERAADFADSMDLSAFGSLQFMHAEAMGDKTMVRMVWSEGPLSLRDLFPEDKDTPGRDLPDLPRPPGSIRIVAAFVEGAAHNVVSYQSTQTPDQVNAFYGSQMKTLGWEDVDLGGSIPDDDHSYIQHAYRKGNRTALLALTAGDQVTGATFIELPSDQ